MIDIYYGILIVLMIAFAPLAALAVMARPSRFWPVLMFAVVLGTGLMVQGYALVDEYWAAAILAAGWLAAVVKKIGPERFEMSKIDKLHIFFFFAFIAYMLAEGLRSLLFGGETAAVLRWIIFYLIIGAIAFVAVKGMFSFPGIKKTASVVCGAGLAYFAAYLGYGLISEKFRWLSWLDLQGNEWSGTAYAVFPLVVALPAAILLFKYSHHRLRALLLLAISVPAAYYYDSRTALIAIFAFFAAAATLFTWQKTIIAGLALSAALSAAINSSPQSWLGLPVYIYDKLTAVVQGNADTDRYLHYQAAFAAVSENVPTFLFGYGLDRHKTVLPSAINEVANRYMPGYHETRSVIRTTGFTALLIDTGFMGLFWLTANFFFTCVGILFGAKRNNRLLAAMILMFAFIWLPVANILDAVMFYFIIMPFGLLWQMTREPAIKMADLAQKK